MAREKYVVNIGDVYGRLTVIEDLGTKNRQKWYKCQCRCGKVIKTTKYRLVYGTSKSCGCYKSENLTNKRSLVNKNSDPPKKIVQTIKSKRVISIREDEQTTRSDKEFASSYCNSVFKRL